MASFLKGAFADAIYKGFKGKLLKGQLYRSTVIGNLDSDGYPVSATPSLYNFEGLTTSYKDFFNQYTVAIEAKVVLLSKSIEQGVVPEKDDIAFMGGQWWQFVDVLSDPAKALFKCAAFTVKIPSGVSVEGGVAVIT
jgi:hypothetical protein